VGRGAARARHARALRGARCGPGALRARSAGAPRCAVARTQGRASRLALHGSPRLRWAAFHAAPRSRALVCRPRARPRAQALELGAPGGGAQAQVSRRLLKHVGLPWEERVMDFHATQRTVQTASLGQACSCSLPQPYL